MTLDELLQAINASGITSAALTGVLQRSSILTDVESKRAEIARAMAARDTANAQYEETLQGLQAELRALEAQAAQSL